MATGRDTGEFEQFAVSRHRALFRFAYLLAGERGLAEDLVQEALTKTYVNWHRLRDSANAEAYTRKAITSTAIGWWRRKSWHAERPRDDVPPLAGPTEDVAARVWLWQELSHLPPRQRAALVLRYYEDLTEVETARIRPDRARRRRHRAGPRPGRGDAHRRAPPYWRAASRPSA
ncbi:sigma-70 family RNA polymerase sigma factor [Kribbella sp. ALI-6-A]|uniref:sigma-70 family RNA polymerase sigma factor n=1 Tax=Kribbella sp. ALI-6-A TaxID=1933817 RepID=UPI000A01A043|nr:sigma-70 family RNA polymerase sigma factor [Kribbella sp. ALI-6-A]